MNMSMGGSSTCYNYVNPTIALFSPILIKFAIFILILAVPKENRSAGQHYSLHNFLMLWYLIMLTHCIALELTHPTNTPGVKVAIRKDDL